MVDYPKDWREVDLINIANTFIGLVTTMTSNYTNDGAKLIRNQDIQNNKFIFKENIYLNREFAELNKSRMHKLGDVVTVHTGDIGTSAVIEESLVGSLGFATIITRLDKKIADPYFISCYFNSQHYKEYVMSIMTGDGRNNLNMRDFNKTRLMLPSLPEQKAIAETLMAFDRHIENLERIIEKKKMICDGAVEDLMTGKERLDGFKGDWEDIIIGNLCYIVTKQTGFDYTNYIKESLKKSKTEMDIPFIQNKDFAIRQVNMNTDYYIPLNVAEKFPKILLDEKCLLISISGKVGNVGIYEQNKKAFLGGAICVLKFFDKEYIDWIMYYLSSKKGMENLVKNEKKSSHKNLTVSDIRKISIPIPHASERKATINILDKMIAEIQTLEKEKAKIEKIKAGAMDDLLTGRVRLI